MPKPGQSFFTIGTAAGWRYSFFMRILFKMTACVGGVILLAVGCGPRGPVPAAQPAQPYARQSVSELVTMLGSPKWKKREAAQRKLEALPPRMLLAVRAAVARSKDQEVKMRGQQVIAVLKNKALDGNLDELLRTEGYDPKTLLATTVAVLKDEKVDLAAGLLRRIVLRSKKTSGSRRKLSAKDMRRLAQGLSKCTEEAVREILDYLHRPPGMVSAPESVTRVYDMRDLGGRAQDSSEVRIVRFLAHWPGHGPESLEWRSGRLILTAEPRVQRAIRSVLRGLRGEPEEQPKVLWEE